ncbi:MAG: ABC transporter ATP-binding protein [Methanomassiliicoccales archaeon]|jgi:ABC-2 type transport system ATP-binding protein|nr:ABC transporter ATP-binding protein [Methanomassiliicoccales archaeon]
MDDPIVIENLTKNFNGFKAVDSLNLTVERKSFVGFLGPNGAGKTTTIKILTHLLSASGGQAYLNGVDVTKDPKNALAGVGAVVETPEFYPYLTPIETLQYLGSLRGMSNEYIQRRTKEVLETVKMTEWSKTRIGKFSKGMKQRLAIAQAMIHEPHVLILDEPTSGLDPRGMVEVRNILKDLRKGDYTIFMSSHLLTEVQEICESVALIDRGKLLAHGSVATLVEGAVSKDIDVRILQPVDSYAIDRISHFEGVERIVPGDTRHFTITFKGGEEDQARLLSEMQTLGLKIVSFKEIGVALESLYMSLIKDSR